jgi:soluble lytic murein transglycosylase
VKTPILFVISLFFLLSIYLNVNQRLIIKEQGRIIQEEVKNLQEFKKKDSVYILQNQRQQCMVKTLMTVYGLSKWESHYYSELFDDFSQEFKIPWEIYPAVIQVESRFKCNVVSPKGAKGIMQIMETTGEFIASEIDMDYVKELTLWNDFCNLTIGCYYLSKYIKDQGLDGGVCSYLGGPAHLKSAKTSISVAKNLKSYKTTVGKEYKTLLYIYQGIISEYGYSYKDLHSFPYSDSIVVNMNLFSTPK